MVSGWVLGSLIVAACSEGANDGKGSAGSAGSGAAPGDGGSEVEVDGSTDAEPPAVDPNSFRATTPMNVARRTFTATLLEDGRVLVVGGNEGNPPTMIADVEVFDPDGESWTELAPLPEPRANHTATLLDDGRVLVAGGGPSSIIGNPSGQGVLSSALLFDPASGAWTPTGSMKTARAAHEARRLPDGRVLVVGGGIDAVWGPCAAQYPNCTVAETTATAEIYDPASGNFSDTDALSDGRMSFTLTTLADGSQLAVGGFGSHVGTSLASAERFDLATLTWNQAGALGAADRLHHSAARLGSGRVLIAGGKKANVAPQTSTQIFDPASDTWSAGTPLDQPRTGALAFELASGRVLIAGGYNQLTQTTLDVAAIYDDASAAWTSVGPLTVGRSLHAGVVLKSGKVLVCGGATPLHSHIDTCDLSE
jgi:hypothetical protein